MAPSMALSLYPLSFPLTPHKLLVPLDEGLMLSPTEVRKADFSLKYLGARSCFVTSISETLGKLLIYFYLSFLTYRMGSKEYLLHGL